MRNLESPPEQVREMDKLYSEKCVEVADLKRRLEIAERKITEAYRKIEPDNGRAEETED